MKIKKGDFSDTELNEIEKMISEYKDIILGQLEIFYSGKTVKAIRK